MDDILIKILDALFDMCDGENYVILDAQDLFQRISDYSFAPGELNECLEALGAEGLVDLRYADDNEFCVSMKSKGRSLIKQYRDRLQRAVNGEGSVLPSYSDAPFAEDPMQSASPLSMGQSPIGRVPRFSSDYQTRSRSEEARPRRDSDEEEEKKPQLPADKKVLLFAFLGAAAGAFLVNLIWLILFLVLR